MVVSCSNDDPSVPPTNPPVENPDTPDKPDEPENPENPWLDAIPEEDLNSAWWNPSAPESPSDNDKFVGIAMTRDQLFINEKAMNYSLDLFRRLVAENPNENVAVSPVGITQYLGMLANATSGDSQKEVLAAWGANDYSIAALNDYFRAINSYLKADYTNISKSWGNAVWVDPSLSVLPSFSASMKDIFGADTKSASLSADQGKNTINEWASSTTHSSVQNLLAQAPGGSVCFSNALTADVPLVFSTYGQNPKQSISKDKFTNSDGSVNDNVNYVHWTNCNYYYIETLNAMYASIYLPGSLRMILIAPVANGDYATVEEGFTFRQFCYIFNNHKGQVANSNLAYPQFTLNKSIVLNSLLSEKGLGNILNGKGTFANLFDAGTFSGNFKIGTLSQAVNLNFGKDSNGSLVTATAGRPANGDTKALNPHPENVNANQPFYMVILDGRSGTIFTIAKICKM